MCQCIVSFMLDLQACIVAFDARSSSYLVMCSSIARMHVLHGRLGYIRYIGGYIECTAPEMTSLAFHVSSGNHFCHSCCYIPLLVHPYAVLHTTSSQMVVQ